MCWIKTNCLQWRCQFVFRLLPVLRKGVLSNCLKCTSTPGVVLGGVEVMCALAKHEKAVAAACTCPGEGIDQYRKVNTIQRYSRTCLPLSGVSRLTSCEFSTAGGRKRSLTEQMNIENFLAVIVQKIKSHRCQFC